MNTQVTVVTELSPWQIAATIATAIATIVALSVAVGNLVQRRTDQARRRQEEFNRALAQARLIITATGNPGTRRLDDDHESPNAGAMEFPFANHSDRAVLHVYAEAWFQQPVPRDGTSRSNGPPAAVHAQVVAAGQEQVLRIHVPDVRQRLKAWRVRWTDADGYRWCRDRYPQDNPEPFVGQVPHRYP